MNPNIKKPNSASRRWKAKRQRPLGTPSNLVRVPYVNTRHNAVAGMHNEPAPVTKPAPLDITAFQKKAHSDTIDKPHIKHANAPTANRVPGIPFRNRKFPNGKHAVALSS